MKTKNKIVTFPCSNSIHIYEEKCGLIPQFPFRMHDSIVSAMNYLTNIGKKNIGIKMHRTISNIQRY